MSTPTVIERAKIGVSCPHCGSPSRIRSSRAVTPLYRQLYCQCPNVDCGFTFGCEVNVTHGISPSAKPNPGIHLRMEAPRKRMTGPGVPAPANDDDVMGRATG